jgi:hypothetical protein
MTEPAFPALARAVEFYKQFSADGKLTRELASKDLEAAERMAAREAFLESQLQWAVARLSTVGLTAEDNVKYRRAIACLPPSLGSRDKSGGQPEQRS